MLILLAIAQNERREDWSRALNEAGFLAVASAGTAPDAVELWRSLNPEVAVVDLEDDTPLVCRTLRHSAQTDDRRIVALVARPALPLLRDAQVNQVVVKPCATDQVVTSVRAVVSRPERRDLTRPDRRSGFRGGRRIVDVTESPSTA